jgi:hypothetical protein
MILIKPSIFNNLQSKFLLITTEHMYSIASTMPNACCFVCLTTAVAFNLNKDASNESHTQKINALVDNQPTE